MQQNTLGIYYQDPRSRLNSKSQTNIITITSEIKAALFSEKLNAAFLLTEVSF